MKALVDKIHAEGFKAQLWWAPLAADPGTQLVKKHPDWLLLNADGASRKSRIGTRGICARPIPT